MQSSCRLGKQQYQLQQHQELQCQCRYQNHAVAHTEQAVVDTEPEPVGGIVAVVGMAADMPVGPADDRFHKQKQERQSGRQRGSSSWLLPFV